MRVIIAGSRSFSDYDLLSDKCDNLLGRLNTNAIEIVSGGCQGPDSLGEAYAEEKGYKITRFPANWKEHGKSAGPIRNREMAEYSDALIAFWDGVSRGTKNMIKEAKKRNLSVRIINL